MKGGAAAAVRKLPKLLKGNRKEWECLLYHLTHSNSYHENDPKFASSHLGRKDFPSQAFERVSLRLVLDVGDF